MELDAVVVDPGMDVGDKHEVQLDAGVELNCEYSSRVKSVGELTAERSNTSLFIVVVALARKWPQSSI